MPVYITKLPKAKHDAPEWQAAIEAPILVEENDSHTMFVRIGVMRALNRHHQSAPKARRKRAKAYKIVK
jgi:hypothetical protein